MVKPEEIIAYVAEPAARIKGFTAGLQMNALTLVIHTVVERAKEKRAQLEAIEPEYCGHVICLARRALYRAEIATFIVDAVLSNYDADGDRIPDNSDVLGAYMANPLLYPDAKRTETGILDIPKLHVPLYYIERFIEKIHEN